MRKRTTTFAKCLAAAAALLAAASNGAEVVTLGEANWDDVVPAGKEVDAIYGDHVLRNDKIVAVVAQALPTRNANLTVKNVGGSLIDLTTVDEPNDQLSCFFPHGGSYTITGPIDWPAGLPQRDGAARLAFALSRPDANKPLPEIVVGYELADGEDQLVVRSLLRNPTSKAMELKLADGVRADGEFLFGVNEPANLAWCHDVYWGQAYGLAPTTRNWSIRTGEKARRRPNQLAYTYKDDTPVMLAAGGTFVFERVVAPAGDSASLVRRAARLRDLKTGRVNVVVTDGDSPVEGAVVKVTAAGGDEVIAARRTSKIGAARFALPEGRYEVTVASNARSVDGLSVEPGGKAQTVEAVLPKLGRVTGVVTDDSGEGVPCRIAFYGEGVADPDWGPESAVHGVKNLWHTADGEYDVELLPGTYKLVISRGPEHDAIIDRVVVEAGRTTEYRGRLERTVDTTGWISAELHSHSSPSGDNTASQRGRVLNLLVDHLEFIPCTEHQRIDTYEPHLVHFGASHRVLTCTGMELTGSPLPINHQNVFPLIHRPRTQDGGAPTIHSNPEVQIERIAMWDNGSDKVVQINHPNINQMVGDRDQNGESDPGFRKMFHFADVIEVHPPELIYAKAESGEGGWEGRGNVVLNWMQLLNQGYRVPGVVNTDAHYNYYGSGWLRNYVKCSSDDPSQADLAEVCHAIEKGQVVVTNGPYLEVTAMVGGNGTAGLIVGPGEDLATAGKTPQLAVSVQCPNWLDVNRVQVFVNGRPDPKLNFLRSASDKFGDGVVKFQHTFDVPLEEDAHLIVVASAEGRELGIVYGKQQGAVMPVAISNPIFVDIDGDGFEPNRDKLDMPLPVGANHRPTHGHDHPHPHR